MPPVVIAAGIGAVGALGGAALASRSSNKATEAGLTANREALAYTREQEAARKAEYDEGMAEYRRQWEAWNATRTALLQRYGIDIAPPQGPAGAGSTGGSGAVVGPAGAAPGKPGGFPEEPGVLPVGPGAVPGGSGAGGPGAGGPVPGDSLWMRPGQRLTLADIAARRGAGGPRVGY